MSEGVHESPPVEADRATEAHPRRTRSPRSRTRRPRARYRRRFAVIYIGPRARRRSRARRVDRRSSRSLTPVPRRCGRAGSRTAATRPASARSPTTSRRGTASPDGEQLVVALGGPPTVTAGGTATRRPTRFPCGRSPFGPTRRPARPRRTTSRSSTPRRACSSFCAASATNCSISQGEASAARHSLLRRRGARALALHLQVPRRHRLRDGLPAAPARRRVTGERGLPPPLATSSRSWRSRSRGRWRPGAPSIGGIPARELQTLNRITSAEALPLRVHPGPGPLGRAGARPSHSLVSPAGFGRSRIRRLDPRLRGGAAPLKASASPPQLTLCHRSAALGLWC